ncbi:MAG TPA: hypothetical protein VF093_04355 [Solirubrobacterales bacterium]
MAELRRTKSTPLPVVSCCAPEQQADCCEPDDKATCCPPDATGCGCQAGAKN